MTILPKKKQSKDKTEAESAEKPPRNASGDSLGHVSRRPSPPPRWNSPTPRDVPGALDPGGRNPYEEFPTHESSSSYKRRHRSSPHRNVRKHRHERHEQKRTSQKSSSWEQSPPHAHGSCASMTHPAHRGQTLSRLGLPSTSTEHEPIEEDHNSGDEYVAPQVPDNISELEIAFENALKDAHGFIIKKMGNDGACLFRAVADQVYGDQEMHELVRQQCLDYMRKNQDFYSQFITEDFHLYLARKQALDSHGNNIEIQAMCELFNRPIEVYQYSTEPINTFIGAYKTDNEPIRVSYHGNVHYNSIVHPYKASIGVGLGLPGLQPGLADKNLMKDAEKTSENFHIEQTMLEDKMRETDWEVTQETIEEQVARESYLQWLRDQEKRGKRQAPRTASATCSSASASQQNWWEALSSPNRSPEPGKSTKSPRSQNASAQNSPSRVEPHPAEIATAVPGCSRSPKLSPMPLVESAGAEGGAVLGPFPGETASIMDSSLPPEMYGIGLSNGWDEDDIIAQVMAQSQQEYLDSLKKKKMADPEASSS